MPGIKIKDEKFTGPGAEMDEGIWNFNPALQISVCLWTIRGKNHPERVAIKLNPILGVHHLDLVGS